MNNSSGALNFDAYINSRQFDGTIQRMERQLMGLSNTAVRESSKMDDTFRRLGQLAGGAFVFRELSELPQQIFKVRGEFQQLETSFTAILKSKEKAETLFSDLRQYAGLNPSSVQQSAQAAKQLLAYGFSAEKIIPTLTKLGDLSAGVGTSIGDLAYLMGTTFTQGRVYVQDFNQFVGRGIPLGKALAETMGVAESEVRGLVEAGKVGFPEIEKAIDNLTKKGSIFGGLAQEVNKGFNGLASQLGDAFDAALNDIGKQNEGLIVEVAKGAISAVQNYQQIIDILKVAVLTYGAYKAAILVVTAFERARLVYLETMALQEGLAALAGQNLTRVQLQQAAASTLLSRAQAALNATMLANPYVLVGTAIVALLSYYTVFADEAERLKTAQELVAEANQEVASKFGQQRSEINTLVGVIKNQNVAESERLKAYDKLKAIAPDIVSGLDFQRAKTTDLTQATNEYLVSLRQRLQLESQQGKVKALYDQKASADEEVVKAQEDVNKNAKNKRGLVIGVGGVSGPTMILDSDVAKRRLDKAVENQKKAATELEKGEANINAILTGRSSKEIAQANITRLERTMATVDKLSPAYKNAEESISAYRKELADITKSESKSQAVKARGIEQIDKEIKAQKALLDTNQSAAKTAEINQKIADLQTERANLQGKKTPAQNKATKEAEKIGQAGSQSYWENEAKVADEALKRIDTSVNTSQVNRLKATKEFATQQAELIQRSLETPVGTLKYYEAIIDDAQKALASLPEGSNPATIATQQYIISQATDKADEIRKRNAVKTFAEELEEKKQQFELYQRWVDAYGKDAADTQFADLKKSGQSYVDYLNTEIAKLEAKKAAGPLSEKDIVNLDNLTGRRNEATGTKSPIDLFTESLDRAKVEAANLTEYLDILKTKQDQLGLTDYAKKRIVSERIVSTTYERDDSIKQYLQSVVASEDQITAIRKKYSDIRAGISEKAAAGMVADYAGALIQIGNDEQKEIDEAKLRRLQDSKEWEALTAKITTEGRKGQSERIDQLRARLEVLKGEKLEATKEYREALRELNDLENEKRKNPLEDFKLFAGLAGELGQALSGVNGALGQTGQLLSGLASQSGLVAAAFKKGIEPQEQIAVGLQGAISLVNILTSSANERRKAEEEYYRSTNAFQQEKNLLLNDEIVLRAKSSQNVFNRDYDRELKANMTKYNDAQAKYQASLAKLGQGQVKVGQRDAIDWTKVGSGAATGAALGTIIPGVGNLVGGLIGGVAGALTGLFGGKKKEDIFGNLLSNYPELIQKSVDGVDTLNVSLAQSLVQSGLLSDESKLLVQSTLDWQKAANDAKEAIKSIVGELAGSLGDSLRNGLVNAFKEGTSAAEAFSTSVSDILSDLVSKMLFSKTFGPAFDKLQAELSDSLTAGDGNVIDDFERFAKDAKGSTVLYEKYLAQFKEAAKTAGFDVLQNPNATKAKGLSGGISASITEATANVLEGQINAIRISQAQSQAIMNQQLLCLTNISNNSNYLVSIDTKLNKLDKVVDALSKDPLRAIGYQPG